MQSTRPTLVRVKAENIGNNTLSIECPYCGAKRNFRRSSLGTSIRCNECKIRIVLPKDTLP